MRTIEYYKEMKNRLARSANQTQNTHLKRELWTAFSKCDTSIAKIVRYYRSLKAWLIIVNVAVLLSIFTSGCGKMLEGVGCISEGIGQGFVAVGQHAQESAQTERK